MRYLGEILVLGMCRSISTQTDMYIGPLVVEMGRALLWAA